MSIARVRIVDFVSEESSIEFEKEYMEKEQIAVKFECREVSAST